MIGEADDDGFYQVGESLVVLLVCVSACVVVG